MAVHHQVIPPATGHFDTHPELTGPTAGAAGAAHGRAVAGGPAGPGRRLVDGVRRDQRAHRGRERRTAPAGPASTRAPERLVRSRQDCEVLLLDAEHARRAAGAASPGWPTCPARLSYAELADLAATLQQELAGRPSARPSWPPSPAGQAARRLGRAGGHARAAAPRSVIDPAAGVFLGRVPRRRGSVSCSPARGRASATTAARSRRRFAPAAELYRTLALPLPATWSPPRWPSRASSTSSVAGLRVLSVLGIEATAAVGHSLGELTGLHWAGAMDEVRAARPGRGPRPGDGAGQRGRRHDGQHRGWPGRTSSRCCADEPVVIAGYNGPRQTVISGPADAVERVCDARRATRAWRRPGSPSRTRSTRRRSRRPPRSSAPTWRTQRFAAAVAPGVLHGHRRRPAGRHRPARPARPAGTRAGPLQRGGRAGWPPTSTCCSRSGPGGCCPAWPPTSRPAVPCGRAGHRQHVADRPAVRGRGGLRAGRAGAARGAVRRPVHPAAAAGQGVQVLRQPVRARAGRPTMARAHRGRGAG